MTSTTEYLMRAYPQQANPAHDGQGQGAAHTLSTGIQDFNASDRDQAVAVPRIARLTRFRISGTL